MRILICSYLFYPGVGGIETVSLILAKAFLQRGHEVKVVTKVASDEVDDFPYEVIRQPDLLCLLKLTQWCDVFLQSNISLTMAWPLLLTRRPWVIVHHTWLRNINNQIDWQVRLKQWAIRFAVSISASQAMADELPIPSVVIGNPYRDDVFFNMPEIACDRELVFLGRIVEQKGLDILLVALKLLQARQLTPRLTVIGSGPELFAMQQLTTKLDLDRQVSFVGARSGPELAKLLNRHQIMVVPSRFFEAFGIVALEGIACGCVVVGSHIGGLKEAIGLCGLTFPAEDSQALAERLADLLSDPHQIARYRAQAEPHLKQYTRAHVAGAYLEVLEASIKPFKKSSILPKRLF